MRGLHCNNTDQDKIHRVLCVVCIVIWTINKRMEDRLVATENKAFLGNNALRMMRFYTEKDNEDNYLIRHEEDSCNF